MSFLLSEGHQHANRYALSKVWYEAEIARERVNLQMSINITLMHSAMVAIMSPGGKGVKNLQKQLKRLRDGE